MIEGRLFRRLVVPMVLGLLGATCTLPASAQHYPARTVTVITAFPPGTPNDVIMRLISDQFRVNTQQSLVVENRPGAGGNIAARAVAESAADGYRLLASVDTVVTVNPVLYRQTGFRADMNLVPVIYLADTALALVCHPSVPAASVSELVALAKARDLSYASGGTGVPGHLAAELFFSQTGVRMQHIPYKGPGPAAQSLLAGDTACGFLAVAAVAPHVRQGRLRALAVPAAARHAALPGVPTLSEAGYPGCEAVFGEVLLAPKGTPPAVIATLNHEIGRVLAQAELKGSLLALGGEFVPNTPQQALQRMQSQARQWQGIVVRLGLQAE